MEAPQLESLSRIPEIAEQVPRLLKRFSFGAGDCVVMDRIPGVTLDRDMPVLEAVTDEALAFLLRLHRVTAVPTPMDEAGYERLISPLLNAAAQRNPALESAIAQWNVPLRRHLAGTVLPAVFQHGDFKVENVIYEPGSGRLMSVIDWEHARQPGLPVLDPLYLLIYNRIIRGAEPLGAVNQVVVESQLEQDETARLCRYTQALGLDDRLMPVWRALFLAHHIGCRMHLPPELQVHEYVKNMVHSMGQALVQSPSPSQA
jgi:aminoglycoside phosphotransferase (APT) family kinase protein